MLMGLKENKKKRRYVNHWKNRHFINSLAFALEGLVTACKEERNLRFHVCSTILVVILGLFFHVSEYEWLWLILCVFLVVSSEIWNSAIENVVDLATGYKRHPLAKKSKDIAAGAVLVAAMFSVVTALVIFGPRIIQLIKM